MSLLGRRHDDLHAQQMAEALIRRRVERHFAGMRSFSPVMRRALAEREVRAKMVAAGLPIPVIVPFDEIVQRHVRWSRRDASHVKTIRDMPLRRAVIAVLEANG